MSDEPRTIRFRFMDTGAREISGLLTIFPLERGSGSRIFASVEGSHLSAGGRYTVDITDEGLILSLGFTADAGGAGRVAKGEVARVPPDFRPRFTIVGPGF